MRTKHLLNITLIWLCSAFAQAAPMGTAFTYQGSLSDGDKAANGFYDLRLSLFDSDTGTGQVGLTITNLAVHVTEGYFTLALDFGSNAFHGDARWLDIGVCTNHGTSVALRPRQLLTPAPSALYATDAAKAANATVAETARAVPATNVTGTLSLYQLPGAVVTNNNAVNVTLAGTFNGSGAGLANVNALTLGGLGASKFWQLGGNGGTTAGVNFLGTTDDEPLELKVYGQRALRLEPNASSAPSLIGGASVNSVTTGLAGGTIGGGYANTVAGAYSSIGGGRDNKINEDVPPGPGAHVIAGGKGNTVWGRSSHNTVGGGAGNVIGLQVSGCTIGGGSGNNVGDGLSTIAGGASNTVLFSTGGAEPAHFIGGGTANSIQSPGGSGAISGGGYNSINSAYAAVGGGFSNRVELSAHYGTISGGRANRIETASDNTVGGGNLNSISKPITLGTPTNSVIAGGYSNRLFSANSVIGGGANNRIGNSFSDYYDKGQTIAGGEGNGIDYETPWAAIGGGAKNWVGQPSSVIGGGYSNRIQWVGGDGGSAIVGGERNLINAPQGSIGGGYSNIVVGQYGVIGGGYSNLVDGLCGSVPGGERNSAAYYGFAAGRRAKAEHTGDFVWADSTDADFASTGNNQFLIRASGGVGIGTTSPGAQLDVRGNVKLGSAGEFFATSGAENLRIVRGIIRPDGSTFNGTGFAVTKTGTGTYSITFTPAFSQAPSLVLTAYSGSAPAVANCTGGTGSGYTSIDTWSGSVHADIWWNFVAVGPR